MIYCTDCGISLIEFELDDMCESDGKAQCFECGKKESNKENGYNEKREKSEHKEWKEEDDQKRYREWESDANIPY